MNRPLGLGESFQNGGLVAYQGLSETALGYLCHNAPVPVGGYVSIWLYGTHNGVVPVPTDVRLTRAERRVLPTDDYTLDVRVHSEWRPGQLRHAIVLVSTTSRIIQGWDVEFDISGGAYISAVDIGKVVQTTSSSALFTYTPGEHRVWHYGQELHLGMSGTTSPGTSVSIENVVVFERVAVPYGGWPDWVPETPGNGNGGGNNGGGGNGGNNGAGNGGNNGGGGNNSGGNNGVGGGEPDPQPTPIPDLSMREFTIDDIAYSEIHEYFRYVKGEVIVTAVLNASYGAVYALMAEHGGEIVGYLSVPNVYQVYFGTAMPEADLWALIDIFNAHESVVLATLNLVSISDDEPADHTPLMVDDYADALPMFISMSPYLIPPGALWADEWDDYRAGMAGGINWGMEAIDAPRAWYLVERYRQRSVSVGILDTGFDYRHEDVTFADLFNNEGLTPGDRSHGIQVAGIIGAGTSENNIGINGLLSGVDLYGFVVGSVREDSDSHIHSIFQYKRALATSFSRGANIVNVSMGTAVPFSGAHRYIRPYQIESLREEGMAFGVFLQQYLNLDPAFEFVIVASAGNASRPGAKLDTGFNGLFTNIPRAIFPDVYDRIIRCKVPD